MNVTFTKKEYIGGLMELTDLAVFKTVVEEGGIIRAAEKLHRVPSNVTTRIQKLEEKVGKPLFIRDKNRLQISTAGQQLMNYAHQILNLADQAIAEIQDQAPSGMLTIGAMEAVAATRLVKPLHAFHEEYPCVDLVIKTAPTGELIEKVLAGSLDLALVADPLADERLVIKPIFVEELVMVSATGKALIKSAKDLPLNPVLLGFSQQCAYRSRLTQWLLAGGRIPKAMEINSYHTLLSCVAAGMGVGMVPKKLVDDYPFAQSIQVHPLPKKWSTTKTAVIWRKDRSSVNNDAFFECLSLS